MEANLDSAESITGQSAAHAGTLDMAALMRDHYTRICGLAWRFGVPQSELEDAAQDVFAAALAGATGFRGGCAPATWLTRIAVNQFVSRRRAWMRRVRLFIRGEPPADAIAATHGPSAELTEAHERAVSCVRRLPERLRAAFVLRYLEEMSCEEVAEVLNIPEATVRTRLFHARQRLRNMLRGFEP